MKKTMVTYVVLMLVLITITNAVSQESAFKWGFRERVRHTYMNNNMDFNENSDDEQGFFRIRTNLWGQYNLSSKLTVKAMLTNEFRPYTIVRERDSEKDMTLDEIILDNLYLQYTTGGENSTTLTLGRQNLIYGEGFILLEGGPWDGSRSIYHDALKVSWKNKNTTIDFLGISNSQYDDRLPKFSFTEKDKRYLGLPKNADGHQYTNDGLEQALGLYMTKKPKAGGQYELYYFLKSEDPDYALPAFSNITEVQKSKLTFSTIGGRMIRPLAGHLNFITEWAYQTGTQSDYSIGAYGGYANLAYTLVPKKKGVLTGGINVLSGDDPETDDVEGWNPVFSRWPKWSELYIYSQTAENIGGGRKVAYWTNTIAPNVKFVMDVHPKVNLTLWAHHLQAFYPSSTGEGKTRGNELQLWLKLKITKQLSGHFLYDLFMPGNFYADPQSTASFIRGEIMFTL